MAQAPREGHRLVRGRHHPRPQPVGDAVPAVAQENGAGRSEARELRNESRALPRRCREPFLP